jgi:hypothetical protein
MDDVVAIGAQELTVVEFLPDLRPPSIAHLVPRHLFLTDVMEDECCVMLAISAT